MRDEWQKVRLGDVADIRTGKLNSNAACSNGKFPFFTCAATPLRIDSFAFDCEAVIVAGNCSPYMHYYNGKFNAYQRTYVVKPFLDSVDGRWLYYWMKTLVKRLISGQRGSVEPYLVMSDFTDAEIPLPPLETQKKIAAVLGALDDKIELNRKMNANLEAQAQALFKSWFVDFTPFGGKKPKDWKKRYLSEIADFVGGYSYKGNELQPSAVAMATIKNFERNGGFKLDGFKEIVPSNKLKAEHTVGLFETLVAHTDLTQNAEVIGNAEMLLSTAGYEHIIMSMDLVKVVPKKSISKFLIGALLKNRRFKSHCLGFVNGTTVLHMSKSALREYMIDLPGDLSILDSFVAQVEPIYRLLAKNIEESRKLAELRDTLLPKLMKGEIIV